ncbi:MAG TPA: hypothetical protein VFX84_02770 [Candidatus Saccharimonadales bacterium]|nr:hypothetical protein [Candidatus Saccharimonadales bacterium]
MGRAIHPLSVEQPNGEPLTLPAEDRSTYHAVARRAAADYGSQVPDYIAAAAVLQGGGDYHRLSNQDMAEIAVDWAAANAILAEGPSPVIYSHRYLQERTVGITDPGASLGFETGRTHEGRFRLGENPAQHLTIPMATHLTVHDYPRHRDEEAEVALGQSVSLFRPLTVLTSGEEPALARFRAYKWYNHATYFSLGAPGDELIVGGKAVSAYLNLMAQHETDEEHTIEDHVVSSTVDTTMGFGDSKLLLSLAMLKEIGFEPDLSPQTKDVVHSAGIKMAARMVVAGIAEGQDSLKELFEQEDVLRRLPAIEVGPDDTHEVTAEALDVLAKEASEDSLSPVAEYSTRTGTDFKKYLHAISGNLLTHILGADRVRTEATA